MRTKPHEPPKFPIRCFLLEPTDRVELSLRRFTPPGCYGPGAPVYEKGKPGIHSAEKFLGVVPVTYEPCGEDGGRCLGRRDAEYAIPEDDERWPQKCARCEHRFLGFPFTRVVDQDPIYRRTDTGEEMTLKNAPFGAMWYADWMGKWHTGPDGRCLMVQVPGRAADGSWYGHDWMVDGRASNCSKPDDTVHRCWVRHGVPPDVTVDKHGNTCKAGAGSILTPGYHGYLKNGFLVLA